MRAEYLWVEERWLANPAVKQVATGNAVTDLQGCRWVQVVLPVLELRNRDEIGSFRHITCYPYQWPTEAYLSNIGDYL